MFAAIIVVVTVLVSSAAHRATWCFNSGSNILTARHEIKKLTSRH
jgi:hypothetical protein